MTCHSVCCLWEVVVYRCSSAFMKTKNCIKQTLFLERCCVSDAYLRPTVGARKALCSSSHVQSKEEYTSCPGQKMWPLSLRLVWKRDLFYFIIHRHNTHREPQHHCRLNNSVLSNNITCETNTFPKLKGIITCRWFGRSGGSKPACRSAGAPWRTVGDPRGSCALHQVLGSACRTGSSGTPPPPSVPSKETWRWERFCNANHLISQTADITSLGFLR